MENKTCTKKILDRIDANLSDLKEWHAKKKNGLYNWINETKDAISFYYKKCPNWSKVIAMAFCSLLLLANIDLFISAISSENKTELIKSNGFWTLVTLIISSPVAFIIWHFRDKNISQQIENSRKDTNLKEFQKLAEWVSGVHLIEDKVTVKIKWEETDGGEDKKIIEETREYTQPSENNAIPTYSKRDGAVGLQISAIYNLLPFYRGDHGESFRRPALNLLLSAWQSMQRENVKKLEELRNDLVNYINTSDLSTNSIPLSEEYNKCIYDLKNKANSPIGIALNQVLLSDGGDNLSHFPEIFINLNLAGINFNIPGVNTRIKNLFNNPKLDCSNIKLQGADLSNININTNFRLADLSYAKLSNSLITEANLELVFMYKSELNNIKVEKSMMNEIYIIDSNCENGLFENSRLETSFILSDKIRNTKFSKCLMNSTNINISIYSDNTLEFCDLRMAYINIRNPIFGEVNTLECFLGSIYFDSPFMHDKFSKINNNGIKIYTAPLNTLNNKYKNIHISQGNYSYSYPIHYWGINLEATRAANPDWEITVS